MSQSTVMEALTAELLGDVGLLHKQIKELPQVIEGMSKEVTDRIEARTSDLLEMTQNHRDLIIELTKNAEGAINSAAFSTSEAAKLDIKTSAEESLGNAIKKSTKDLDETLTKIKGTGDLIKDQITKAANNSVQAIRDANKEFNKERYTYIFYCFLASLLGALIPKLLVFLFN